MLIDVHSLLNRAFYGIAGRSRLTAPDGLPTGALYAFLNMLTKYRESYHPTHIVSAMDMPGGTFRHRQYEDYKKGRSPMPDDLARQVPIARDMLKFLGYNPLGVADYEADDLLGTLARRGEEKGMRVFILSGDRDILQLITGQTSVILLTTNGDGSESVLFTPEQMMETYGLPPSQWVEVKGLMGDSSDNIPGVRGVGQKTALKLIQDYGSIEEVYSHLDDQKGALQKKLRDGKEMAAISRELSVICREVPIRQLETLLSSDVSAAMDREALAGLLERLNFRSFLERFDLKPSQIKDESGSVIQCADGVSVCASETEWIQSVNNDAVAFLLPDEGAPGILLTRGRSFEVTDGESMLRLMDARENVFITWDFKRQLRANGLNAPRRVVFDVMIAAYLLNELGRSDDPEFALRASLGENYQPFADDCPPLLRDQKRERKRLCYLLLLAREKQIEKLNERELMPLTQVEMELVSLLAEMEQTGILVDRAALDNESVLMLEELKALEQAIYREAGHSFNINSPQQLGHVLYEEMDLPTGRKSSSGQFSTAADELERLRGYHPVIESIIEYREISKLRGTFLEGLKKEIARDGRVHTTFNQAVTTTGRLSSSNPNLQNIPVRTARGKRIRELFTASPGNVLVGADYSQIELRLLAHLSGDHNLSAAFREGRDVHLVTASRLFGKAEPDISSRERSIAKTVNFSITYGISDFGLSRDLNISIPAAGRLIERYHNQYPLVESWLRRQGETAKEQGYVETLFHRRRYLPELQSQNRNIVNFGMRAAMNAPVQGTAADLIKIAMVGARRLIRDSGLDAKIILQVHDELILEVSEKDAAGAESLLRNAMEHAIQLDIPLIAEAKQGLTWGDIT